MATATKPAKSARGAGRRVLRKRPGVPARWRKLFGLIPGYDPEAMSLPGDYFDVVAAERAVAFIESSCKHIEGSMAGEPFILAPWEAALVGCLFGWMRADGLRRYRELWLYVPRGNGKTPLLAAIALYLLFCDGEAGAQIYFVASESKQAGLAYRHAKGMVSQNEVLAKASQIFKGMGHRSIVLKDDEASSILVISSDAKSKHGFNPHGVLGDELHAWEDRELLEALETAFAKKGRLQPMKLLATTADFDRPSPCNDKHDYAISVRDNGGDPTKPGYDNSLLPVIYEASVTDDWTDEQTWEKVNPNIDVTVDRASLRLMVQKAIQQPARQAEFKRLHLNVRTTSRDVYIPLEQWDTCGGAVDRAALSGRLCYGALDVSSKRDITAYVLCFPPTEDDDQYVLLPQFWVPADNVRAKEHEDKVPYRSWSEAGLVTMTDDDMIDEDEIQRAVLASFREFNLVGVGYDRWNAQGLGGRLATHGVDMIEIPQTISHLTTGTKALRDLVAQGSIQHGDNPVLRWMLSCTETKADTNQNERPVKPDRKTGKRIDGIVAAIMAVGLSVNRVEQTPMCVLL